MIHFFKKYVLEGGIVNVGYTSRQDGNSFCSYGARILVTEIQNKQIKILQCLNSFFSEIKIFYFYVNIFSIATKCGYINEDMKSLI